MMKEKHTIVDLHDFEITTIQNYSLINKVKITLFNDDVSYILTFSKVYDASLDNFSMQNIVFKIHIYSVHNISLFMSAYGYTFDDRYINNIPNNSEIFYLDSSVGLYGYIIADEYTLEKIAINTEKS